MNTLNVMTITRKRWFHLGVAALAIILLSWMVALHLGTSIQIHMPEAVRETPSALTAARQRFYDFKQAQAERVSDALVSTPQIHGLEAVRETPSALTAARQRFYDFKQAQAERMGGALVSTPSAAQRRFEDFKRRQIEQ